MTTFVPDNRAPMDAKLSTWIGTVDPPTPEQIERAMATLCRHHAEDLAVVLGIATADEQAASNERAQVKA